jgi:hypothetical protein
MTTLLYKETLRLFSGIPSSLPTVVAAKYISMLENIWLHAFLPL